MKPQDEGDYQITSIPIAASSQITGCFVRMNACDKAWQVFKAEELGNRVTSPQNEANFGFISAPATASPAALP